MKQDPKEHIRNDSPPGKLKIQGKLSCADVSLGSETKVKTQEVSTIKVGIADDFEVVGQAGWGGHWLTDRRRSAA